MSKIVHSFRSGDGNFSVRNDGGRGFQKIVNDDSMDTLYMGEMSISETEARAFVDSYYHGGRRGFEGVRENTHAGFDNINGLTIELYDNK